MRLTMHVELVSWPRKHYPSANYRSRVLLKDEEDPGRARAGLLAAEHRVAVVIERHHG